MYAYNLIKYIHIYNHCRICYILVVFRDLHNYHLGMQVFITITFISTIFKQITAKEIHVNTEVSQLIQNGKLKKKMDKKGYSQRFPISLLP